MIMPSGSGHDIIAYTLTGVIHILCAIPVWVLCLLKLLLARMQVKLTAYNMLYTYSSHEVVGEIISYLTSSACLLHDPVQRYQSNKVE